MTHSYPRKALILAAGYGTRMGPLSADLPKPMMPLWGKPLIKHAIDQLVGWGVEEIYVNAHHNSGTLIGFLTTAAAGRVSITVSRERTILGTGGALRKLRRELGDQPYWILNSDVASDLEPERLLRASRKPDCIAALWLHRELGPRTVEMTGGLIRDFASRRPGKRGTFTFCGLQLVRPEILKYVPQGFSSIIDVYRGAMKENWQVRGVTVRSSFWADLGSSSQYLDAHRKVLDAYRKREPGARLMDPGQANAAARLVRRGVEIRGFVANSGGKISTGASLEDCVVWPGARLGRNVRLRQAIVGRDVAANTVLSGALVRCDRAGLQPSACKAIKTMGWDPDRTVLIPLGRRGSDRVFNRLACGRATRLMIQYGTERKENARFAGHAEFLLQQGLPVPEIYVDDRFGRVCIVEDLGDETLEKMIHAMSNEQMLGCYDRLVECLARLHSVSAGDRKAAGLKLEPSFTARLYKWEHDLFAEHFLASHLGMTRHAISSILEELSVIAEKLLNEPKVLLHRDMQSSNVMFRGDQPVLIDFQGMRMGPAVYDLASLLCDPYVMLSKQGQRRVMQRYVETLAVDPELLACFWPAAIQRLVQSLGAYARLARLPGMGRFSGYMRPALTMMRRALAHVDGFRQLRTLLVKGRRI